MIYDNLANDQGDDIYGDHDGLYTVTVNGSDLVTASGVITNGRGITETFNNHRNATVNPPVEPPTYTLTTVPDPNAPDSPEQIIVIIDGVPLTFVKVESEDSFAYYDDDGIPLGGFPEIKDTTKRGIHQFNGYGLPMQSFPQAGCLPSPLPIYGDATGKRLQQELRSNNIVAAGRIGGGFISCESTSA